MNDVKARKPTSDLAEYKVPGAFMVLPLRVMKLKRCNGRAVTITAKVVFAKLAWNYRRSLEFPNASQALAADFGVSRNAILRAIACLVAAHLIQRIARRRPNGMHHVNGYALIPADLVADDADLPNLTAEVRSRRDEWDAACAAIVAETAASGSDEFYGRDEWPSADDAPDDEPYDVPERNIGAMCQNGTTESMSQIGAARCAETAPFDAPERDTANGTTHRVFETRRKNKEISTADDMDTNSQKKSPARKFARANFGVVVRPPAAVARRRGRDQMHVMLAAVG